MNCHNNIDTECSMYTYVNYDFFSNPYSEMNKTSSRYY